MRSSPSIQLPSLRTASSSSAVASCLHGRLHDRVPQADDQHVSDTKDTTAAGSSKSGALSSACAEGVRRNAELPSVVSLCGAMTSAVVLHALAADQDATHFSVSLCAGKPASRDQFRKACLKDVEASHSAGHKVPHHAVSAGSCYGEYTNFIQLLLKTRARK